MRQNFLVPSSLIFLLPSLSETELKCILYLFFENIDSLDDISSTAQFLSKKYELDEEQIVNDLNKIKNYNLFNTNLKKGNLREYIKLVFNQTFKDKKIYNSDIEKIYKIIKDSCWPELLLSNAEQLTMEYCSPSDMNVFTEICKHLAKAENADDLDDLFNVMCNYISLEKGIKEGIPNVKGFTNDDRKIIYKWAQNYVDISDVYDAYSISIKYTQKLSLKYIDVILTKWNKV